MELTEQQIKELSEKRYYLAIEDPEEEKATPQLQAERRIIHWISTPSLDRVADIMMPKGCNHAKFDETKTVYINHDYDRACGKNVKINLLNDGIKVATYFSKETMQADDEYRLHMEGVVNGWSIGFKSLMDIRTGRTKEGSVEWKEGTNIRIFNEWELLEYSSTGIPANPECLDIAKSIVKSIEYKNYIDKVSDKLTIDKFIAEQKKEISDIKQLIDTIKADKEALVLQLADYAELKKAIQDNEKATNEILTKLAAAGSASAKKLTADEISLAVKNSVAGVLSELTGRKF